MVFAESVSLAFPVSLSIIIVSGKGLRVGPDSGWKTLAENRRWDRRWGKQVRACPARREEVRKAVNTLKFAEYSPHTHRREHFLRKRPD